MLPLRALHVAEDTLVHAKCLLFFASEVHWGLVPPRFSSWPVDSVVN